MSAPGSPGCTESSGGSDLMALLDQLLPSTAAAEKDDAISTAYMSRERDSSLGGTGAKRRRLDSDTSQQQCPPHPGLMHGMCIRCGAEVSQPDQPGIPLRYLHLGLQISSQEAERIRAQHLTSLLSKKKLLLVLDLDHTLLVSTRMADLPEDMLPKLEKLLTEQGTGEQQLLYKLLHMLMWTKLRPGIREFLVEAHKLFELHIYTHGDQDYAAEMAKLLDPKKTLFGGRVISGVSMHCDNQKYTLLTYQVHMHEQQLSACWCPFRNNKLQPAVFDRRGNPPSCFIYFALHVAARLFLLATQHLNDIRLFGVLCSMRCPMPYMQRDSTQRHVKNLDVVLGADTSVLILDDTEGVWPQHAANLIQVDRYIFFPACATRFGRSHKCLLEKGKDESADTGMLSTSLRVLQQVHTSLFVAAEPSKEDVREHLQELRRQVLQGVHLVFSHVIPLEQDMTQHPLWQLATQLGATCHAKVSEDITHVVSTAQDTDKMHWAKRHNRYRVSVNWLFVSGFQWKRAAETKHPVENKKANVMLPSVIDDTAAAIAGAGGGRGLDQELD